MIVQHIANFLDISTGKIGSGATYSPAVQILDHGLFIPFSHYFLNTSFAHWLQVANLSHRYVLSYVNILKYLPSTYMERLIIARVAVDRSVLMSALSRAHLSLPGNLATTNDCH